MFGELEKKIIIMALMYLKNDYTADDLSDLGLDYVEVADGNEFEKICQILIEDFIGPTWDEETTTANINAVIKSLTRNGKDAQQLELFPEET